MSKKPTFGLDLDGCVYDFDSIMRYLLREVKDPPLPEVVREALRERSTAWDTVSELVGKRAWDWLWDEGLRRHGLFRLGHPCKGALKFVDELAQRCRISIITHRPSAAVRDTIAWLNFVQLPIEGLHILTNQEDKSSVGPYDYYLDDKLENVLDLAENTEGYVFMIDRPWNQEPADIVERVFDYETILEAIDELR